LNRFMGPVDDYVTTKYLLQSPKSKAWGKGEVAAHAPSTRIRSSGWRIHGGVEDTKFSTIRE